MLPLTDIKSHIKECEEIMTEIDIIHDWNIFQWWKKLDLHKQVRTKQSDIFKALREHASLDEEDNKTLESLEEELDLENDFPRPSLFKKYDTFLRVQAQMIDKLYQKIDSTMRKEREEIREDLGNKKVQT